MKVYKYKINGQTYEVVIKDIADGEVDVEVNGLSYHVENVDAPKPAKRPQVSRPKPASHPEHHAQAPEPQAAAKPTGEGTITSPLPGVILDMQVKEGDTVKAGQTLLVLEAMKMENSIEAEADGKVIKVYVKAGDSVMEGDALVTIGG
ncbi:MAG: acetyl-CoA carboxylase biotin carboxyl carrier protein subunit [Bacteroidetes bacterium]|nr:MAG: acetyl-CoA carboxylase biotin carboxyl carrier protein subunit [Bacteroidota bacterium]